MTEAEKAYAEAERRIEEALESGAEVLEFDHEATHALTALPAVIGTLTALRILELGNTQVTDVSPLSDLTGLIRLWLDGTQVSDLSPLSGLTGLTELGLDGTQVSDLSPLSGLTELTELGLNRTAVSDLRPLRGHRKVVKNPKYSGLTFLNTAATDADPKIAEIAEIEDHSARARALFDYLEDWVPPWERLEDPDDLFPVDHEDGKLEIAATCPEEEEVEERLKQVLYAQLREKAADLARAAGNRFPRLAARARSLETQLKPDFAETDLLLLHLAVEDLRTLSEHGAEEDGDPFPSEVTIPLTEVVNRGPGLTLGNSTVDTLVERANRRRASERDPEDVQQAQDAMSDAVAGDPNAVGDRLRALETQVSGGATAEAQEVQRAANRNILWRIAATLLADTRGATVGVLLSSALGPSIGAFAQTNLPILAEAAATYGPGFQGWFMSVIFQAQDMTHVVDTYRRRRTE